MANPAPPLEAETIERINALLDDGCPYKEVSLTTGVTVERLKKEFPGRGWTIQQAGKFAAEVRAIMRRTRPEYRVPPNPVHGINHAPRGRKPPGGR